MPVGLLLLPLATSSLSRATAPTRRSTFPGLTLASGGLLGIVWGLIHGNGDGWTSPGIVGASLGGAACSRRSSRGSSARRSRCCRCGSSATARSRANGASLLMYFGMFGSIFLLSQFFQTAQGYSPLGSGLRTLPLDAHADVPSLRSRARSPTGSAGGR